MDYAYKGGNYGLSDDDQLHFLFKKLKEDSNDSYYLRNGRQLEKRFLYRVPRIS